MSASEGIGPEDLAVIQRVTEAFEERFVEWFINKSHASNEQSKHKNEDFAKDFMFIGVNERGNGIFERYDTDDIWTVEMPWSAIEGTTEVAARHGIEVPND